MAPMLRSRGRGNDSPVSPRGASPKKAASPDAKQGKGKGGAGGGAAGGTSAALWLGIAAALLIPVVLVVVIEGLPEEATADASSPFQAASAARTRRDMQGICDLGTRLIGSEANEVHAVEYLVRALSEIQAGASDGVVVEIATQHVTGSFNTGFLGGVVNAYQGVSNVMCRLSLRDPASRGAGRGLLINAHYDSSVSSPGAIDDVVNVALMLELARLLAASPADLAGASVVLLFNGAEEANWQAAHGFISSDAPLTQRGATPLQAPASWRASLAAVINLESIGSSGREFLVRTGKAAGWLSELYRDVVRFPRGTVLSEEIFDSGVFPGETDFLVFRDVGRLQGVDIVWVEDGYNYHSPRDRPETISDGAIRRTGGHVHAYAKAVLARLGAGGDPPPPKRAVFFDVLGVYMFWYPEWEARLVNFGAIAWAGVHMLVVAGRAGGWGRVGRAAVRELGCLLGGILTAVLCGVCMAAVNPMAWYSNFPLSPLLYCPGAVLGCLLARARTLGAPLHPPSKDYGSGGLERHLALCGAMVLVCAFLGAMTVCGVLSAYLFLPMLLAMLLARVGGGGVGVHLVACAVPAVYWMQVMRTVLLIFQPVMGRSGMAVAPDIFMALICGAITSLMCLPLLTVLAGEKSIDRRIPALLVTWVLAVAAYSASVWPYTLARPKRLIVQHTDRAFYDERGELTARDSGVWVNGFDWRRLSDLQGRGVGAFDAAKPHDGCDKGPCSMPWFFPMRDVIKGGWYVPFKAPEVPAGLEFGFSQASEALDGGGLVRRVHVTAGGPSHMAAYILDPDKRVVGWSFADQIGSGGLGGKRRSDGSHFIYFASGGGGSRRNGESGRSGWTSMGRSRFRRSCTGIISTTESTPTPSTGPGACRRRGSSGFARPCRKRSSPCAGPAPWCRPGSRRSR